MPGRRNRRRVARQNEGWWFSDGYGDYIRHFLVAMAAVPGVGSSRRRSLAPLDVGRDPRRLRPDAVVWTTFDREASETLRLTFRPASVLAAGVPIAKRDRLDADGYTERPLDSGGFLVRVRHSGGGEVIVSGSRS